MAATVQVHAHYRFTKGADSVTLLGNPQVATRNIQCQQISAHIIQPTISNSCSLNPQPHLFR